MFSNRAATSKRAQPHSSLKRKRIGFAAESQVLTVLAQPLQDLTMTFDATTGDLFFLFFCGMTNFIFSKIQINYFHTEQAYVHTLLENLSRVDLNTHTCKVEKFIKYQGGWERLSEFGLLIHCQNQ